MGNFITDGVEGVGGSAYDIFQSATGGETRAQESGQQQQEEAKAASESARKQLELQQRGLDVQGSDPASIQQHDNWEEWDHQRLVTQLRDSLQIEDINKSGRAWEKLGQDIAELFADLDKETRAAAGDGMQGQAAEAGLGAAKPLQEWGKSFGDSVRMTGLKVQEVGVTAEQTKQSIQPPSDPSTARTLLGVASAPATMGLGGLADAGLQMKEQSEDEKRARAVAQKVYTPGYSTVDQSTPSLPPPVDPLNPPPPPPGANQPNVPGSQNPSISGQPPGQSATPSGSSPSGVSPSGTGGSHPSSPSGPPAQSGSSWANSPHAPGNQPHGGGMPPGGGPGGPAPVGGMIGGGMPGGAPGGGAGGAGRGAGGAGAGRGAGGAGAGASGRAAGGGMGAGGRSGAGAAGGGAGAAGAAGGAGAGARGAGGAAGGGAGAGAGRGQGEGDDPEHERPSWLEEQDDIWLEDMPKTAPAVFGDWG